MQGVSLRRPSAVVAGAAAQLAGVIWILQWAHVLVAHGPTSYNQAQVWLGMTWLDSAKFLALAYLLLIPGVVYVVRSLRATGDTHAAGLGAVALGTIAVCAITTLLEFRTNGWGSYVGAFDPADKVVHVAGRVRAVASSMVLTAVVVVLVVRGARSRVIPYWVAPVLGVGCVATAFIAGPLPPVSGLAWLAFGAWLLAQHDSSGLPRAGAADAQLSGSVRPAGG